MTVMNEGDMKTACEAPGVHLPPRPVARPGQQVHLGQRGTLQECLKTEPGVTLRPQVELRPGESSGRLVPASALQLLPVPSVLWPAVPNPPPPRGQGHGPKICTELFL